jgi:hypothetical protein
MKHHSEITDDMISIFVAILHGGDANKRLAEKLIRKLDARARRDLRASIQTFDALIDDVWLEELREKRIEKQKLPPNSKTERAK